MESDESTSGSEGEGESWVDSYSSCSSDTDPCCDDRSPIPWEAEVQESGKLFYIESYPQLENSGSVLGQNISNSQSKSKQKSERLAETPSNITPGKLIRLIRHRESKRRHKNGEFSNVNNTALNLPVRSNLQIKEKEVYHVVLNVDPWLRQNLGRRATSTESILGLVTTTGPDCEKVVVTGFVPDGPAAMHGEILIGDCLIKINGQNVSANTINLVIRSVTTSKEVQLAFERRPRSSTIEDIPDISSQKEITQTPFVQQLTNKNVNKNIVDLFLQWSVLVMFLQTDGLVEGGPEDQGIFYCFPRPIDKNTLGQVKGAFLTLQHLLPDVAGSAPKSSTVLVRGFLSHVVYALEGTNGLLLLCIPQKWCLFEEFSNFCDEVVRVLRFGHQKLHSCFSDKSLEESLDNFFTLCFLRLINEKSGLASTFPIDVNLSVPRMPLLEYLLPAAQWIPLPREAQVQLDDALSELESNDLGDFCEDHNCQRLFTILGSCVYHKGYLLSSHMASPDVVDVHSFCRVNGLLDLLYNEPVRSLVVWQEVFPSSCLEVSQEESVPYQLSSARWFLLLVGQKQNLIAVLLEAGGCSGGLDDNPGPDSLYVEAVEDTLRHIERTGAFSIASKWIDSNLRPQPVPPETIASMMSQPRRINNLLGLRLDTGASLLRQTGTGTSTRTGSSSSRASHEMPLLIKKQSPEHSAAYSGQIGIHGETSEDSGSLAPSLPSDEFIPSRRHDRYDESDDSDSDYDLYHDHSSGQRSRMDLSSLNKSILQDVENVLPNKLTAGADNMLFHFVHLDMSEGIVLSPPVKNQHTFPFTEILENFRRCSLHIHTLLQNSITFKNLNGADISRSSINKSLVAVKEFGALFECRTQHRAEKSAATSLYWVVGRLFFVPNPREMYVCYHDGAPQNMVEMAFRVGLNSAG